MRIADQGGIHRCTSAMDTFGVMRAIAAREFLRFVCMYVFVETSIYVTLYVRVERLNSNMQGEEVIPAVKGRGERLFSRRQHVSLAERVRWRERGEVKRGRHERS